MTPRTLLAGLLLALLSLLTFACKREASSTEAVPSASLTPDTLPEFELKDDTKNVLFTWVDDAGDFKVVRKRDDVPESGRQQVRVAKLDQSGSRDWVYVADLTNKRADGSYPVKTMSRAEWDEVGAKRRKLRLEALAPSAAPSASAPPPVGSGAPVERPAAGRKLSAIVYGADWCKPCHAAEAYLKQRGLHVVKKDIDESEAARAEMRKKLDKAGMGGAQIPIIDVMGQLLVGYSPAALDRAIQSARGR